MFLFKLAFLNIARNPRRSIITVLAVGVGLAALIFLWGFSDGTNEQMRENVIRLLTGHVQIHAPGYQNSLSPELTLQNREGLIQKLTALPNMMAFSERVKCEALIGTSEKSRGVILSGIDPERETKVTDLKKYIKEGEFLTNGANREIVIGDRLAKKVDLKVGDKAVVMTQAMDGTLSGFSYYIKGIFHTGSQTLDEVSAYISLNSAQELLTLDHETHEIVIRLARRKAIPAFLKELKTSLPSGAYDVSTWDEIVPEVEQWAKWSEAIIRTILFAVMIVIGVSIMNTVLMSVFERTRELGVMMAIGTSPGRVIRLILLETFILELFGIALGLVLGYLVTLYFAHVGIAFPELERAFSRSYMSTVTYTRVEPVHVIQSIITLFALTSFIGLYPAWKAGRMEPIKAIYRS